MALYDISVSQMESSAEAVAAVIADRHVDIIYVNKEEGAEWNHNKNALIIPRLGTMSQKDMVVWFSNLCHEAGHAWFTKYKKVDIKVLFDIWNAVEDVVMERHVGQKFIGAKIAFHDSTKHFNVRAAESLSNAGANRPIIWEALVYMMFLDGGVAPAWTISPKAKEIYDIAWPIFCKNIHCKNSQDTFAIAEEIFKAIYDLFDKRNNKQDKKENKDEKKEENKPSDDKSTPDQNGDKEEESKGKKLDKKIVKKMGKLSEGETVGEFNRSRVAVLMSEEPVLSYGGRYTSYKARDKVIIPEQYKEGFDTIINSIRGQSSALRRQLENNLRCLCNSVTEYDLTRGTVDNSSLAGFAITGNTRIFMQKRKSVTLSTAVSIVIDQSDSMNGGGGARGGKIYHCRNLAVLVGECFSGMNIPFEIIGTHTTNIKQKCDKGFTRENPVNYFIYKGFNENWNVVRSRIASMTAIDSNVDGEAIEFAAHRLAQRKETRKIIFSLSDGQPCGGIIGDYQSMGENLIKVCAGVRKAGIECYGFGICTETPKYYYGEDNFIYVENSEQLDSSFFSKLSKVLVKKP